MNKHYYVTQRLRLYGRSYEPGEVIEADDADVADLVGSTLKEATLFEEGTTLLGNQDGKQALRALVQESGDEQVDQGNTQPTDAGQDGGDTPPADDSQSGQASADGQSDAASDSADGANSQPSNEQAVQPAVKKASPVVKKASATKGSKK